MTIEKAAAAAFDASELVKILEMKNWPTDYDKRKETFIELAKARAKEYQANLELEKCFRCQEQ